MASRSFSSYRFRVAVVVLLHALCVNSTPTKASRQGWSSIIGVVTSIVGNILISVALNTQRYAHLRLQREHENRGGAGNSSFDDHGYGAIEREIADERSRKNAEARAKSTGGDTEEVDETEPLIPSIHSLKSNYSGDLATGQGEKDDDHSKKQNYLKSPYWWIGITLMVVGEAGNFLAYGFAPASVVSPLGVVALISNCLIAPLMLKERFRKRDFVGVLIAIAGAVTVVLSAKGSNPKLGPNAIWNLIKQWEFLTYLGITVLFIIVFMFLSNRYGDRTIVIDIGLVGLFGGFTALSTKGVASLLSYELFKSFTFPITYLLIAVLIVTAVMQIKYVNRALQRFDSTLVIPTQFVTFTIFVVVGSAVLYRDFENTTVDKVLSFVGGVVLTFLGVWTITSGRKYDNHKSEHKQTESSDEEQRIDMVDEEGNNTTTETPSTPVQQRRAMDDMLATPQSQRTISYTPETPLNYTTAQQTPSSFRYQSTPEHNLRPGMHSALTTPQFSMGGFSSEDSTSTSAPDQAMLSTSTPSQGGARTSQPRRRSAAADTLLNPSAPGSLSRSGSRRFSTSRLLNREFISPGPFTSPLSSGLSVVIADAKKGHGNSSNARRGSSSIMTRDRGGNTPINGRPGLNVRGNSIEVAQTEHSITESTTAESSQRTSSR